MLKRFLFQAFRRRTRRTRMWNMGIIFLIYYTITIYSVKSNDATEKSLDADEIPITDENNEPVTDLNDFTDQVSVTAVFQFQ